MRNRTIAGLGFALTTLLGGLATAPAASSAPTWAPAASAGIHPGVMMVTEGAQCTANFVFTEETTVYTDETTVYLGYAAHCAGTGGATETDGCLAGSLPLGTPVEIDGATEPGTLAYSSWLAMQAAGEADPNACAYNDFALVRLHPDDVVLTNPSIPHWGGPVGMNADRNPTLASVYSYGNSSLRLGIALLSPKSGASLGTTGGGWTHPVYTVTPGIPGDSGSAMLDADGQASGVLSTVSIAPLAGSNHFSDLNLALAYMRSKGGPKATLALGTEAFRGSPLPVGV